VWSHSELTDVWSNQRHRVEVGELHVLGQVLGVLLQQLRQLRRAAPWDVVLTLSEGPPQPRGTRTQQNTAASHQVLQAEGRGMFSDRRKEMHKSR